MGRPRSSPIQDQVEMLEAFYTNEEETAYSVYKKVRREHNHHYVRKILNDLAQLGILQTVLRVSPANGHETTYFRLTERGTAFRDACMRAGFLNLQEKDPC